MRMNKKSSMNVHTAAIASRTKMKPSVIKIHSTFGGILGLALHYPDMQRLFTHPLLVLTKRILVGIVGKISPVRGSPLHHPVDTKSQSQQIRIGRCGSSTCKKCTNLESAITRRSSSGQIISGST